MSEIKIQFVLRGGMADQFVASMRINHRTMAGEAAYRIEQSLRREKTPPTGVAALPDVIREGGAL